MVAKAQREKMDAQEYVTFRRPSKSRQSENSTSGISHSKNNSSSGLDLINNNEEHSFILSQNEEEEPKIEGRRSVLKTDVFSPPSRQRSNSSQLEGSNSNYQSSSTPAGNLRRQSNSMSHEDKGNLLNEPNPSPLNVSKASPKYLSPDQAINRPASRSKSSIDQNHEQNNPISQNSINGSYVRDSSLTTPSSINQNDSDDDNDNDNDDKDSLAPKLSKGVVYEISGVLKSRRNTVNSSSTNNQRSTSPTSPGYLNPTSGYGYQTDREPVTRKNSMPNSLQAGKDFDMPAGLRSHRESKVTAVPLKANVKPLDSSSVQMQGGYGFEDEFSPFPTDDNRLKPGETYSIADAIKARSSTPVSAKTKLSSSTKVASPMLEATKGNEEYGF